jgi:hypothetical protein
MITKTNSDGTIEKLFIGRVLEVEKTSEQRNWSDTMDYSDWRTTNCTYALVWLGPVAVPPTLYGGRQHTYAERCSWQVEKQLSVGEQFAWVDCTGLFADRNGHGLSPAVDTFDMQLLHGGPLMLDNLVTWRQLTLDRDREQLKAVAARRAEADAAEAVKAAASAKRSAAAAAKLEASRAAANEDFKKIPAKGAMATVDGVTGKVFWTGVTKYRGAFAARYGVKNAQGVVAWGKVG